MLIKGILNKIYSLILDHLTILANSESHHHSGIFML